MEDTFPKELNLEKLITVATGWVEEYAGYIAEISFFYSTEISDWNPKEHQYCIDFVLCDPPRIEPESRFKSGFIAKEISVLSIRLLEAIPRSTKAELEKERRNARFDDCGIPIKETDFLNQWRVNIRWETDQQDNSYIPESKQILYLRPKNQPHQELVSLSQNEYEHLRKLPYFTIEECISLMTGIPYESTDKAIVNGELDIQAVSGVRKKFKDCLDILTRSVEVGDLRLKDNSKEQIINADQFIKWANDKGYEPCVALYGTRLETAQQNTNPDSQQQSCNDDVVKDTPVIIENGSLITSLERSINKIMFEYIGDPEVKIRVKRNDMRILTAKSLGFDLTKGETAWKVFIDILEYPPHKYICGPSKTKAEKTAYQRKYGYLREISKKLITNFFNKELSFNLPDNYKLFESVKGETGVFQPIFRVKDRSTLSSCTSKNDFLFKFRKACKAANHHPNDRNKQQLVIDLVQNATENNYLAEVEEETYWRKAKKCSDQIDLILKKSIEKGHKLQDDFQPQDQNIDYTKDVEDLSS